MNTRGTKRPSERGKNAKSPRFNFVEVLGMNGCCIRWIRWMTASGSMAA